MALVGVAQNISGDKSDPGGSRTVPGMSCKCCGPVGDCYCIKHPWLTTIDWPVKAFEAKEARNSAVSATSSIVVNSPSTVSFSMMVLMTSCSEMPSSLACSGICLSTSGVRTKPGQITLARTPCAAPSLATNFRQTDQAVFGGDIWSFEYGCLLRVHRTHIDDASAFLLVHLTERSACGQEGAIEMNGH